jgi:hypothetical protein
VIHLIDAVLTPATRPGAADSGFKPIMEAKLPQGFPDPTPVDTIEVKNYPAYRLARTPMADQKRQGEAFFTLFNHITKNSIAMTAPVELTYRSNNDGAVSPQAMAFLYENTGRGTAGQAGKVTVIDVPASTVVSLGMRGDFSGDRIAGARARLEAYLKEAKRYQIAGPLRVMGYNSPFVPVARRYFEVQLPVTTEQAQK